MADNIDWLDCFIDAQERKTAPDADEVKQLRRVLEDMHSERDDLRDQLAALSADAAATIAAARTQAAEEMRKRASVGLDQMANEARRSEDGFRSSWSKICDKAKIDGVTFHDLRGTAVTRLFIAGCTDAEVATITGHSLTEVRSILDANYFSRDMPWREAALPSLRRARKLPTKRPTTTKRLTNQKKKVSDIKWLGNLDSNQD